jgi:hypothetical protein
MTQAASPDKPREDKGLFTQFPIVLFDEYADKMPAASFVAFTKFYRHYGYKGIFKGSIRKLCHALNMARMTVYRAIEHWVKCGLVRKGEQRKTDENRDEMVLLIEGNDLWKQNIEHSKSLGWCPKSGQSLPIANDTVPENEIGVPNRDNSGSNRDSGVPNLDHFVPPSRSKSPPYITEDNSQITLDQTEDSGDTPGESPPSENSFIQSSNSLSSQEIEISSSPGGAVHTPQQPGESEPPNSDAVGETIASVDQLRFWFRKLGIRGSSNTTKKTADLEKILPGVTSKERLVSLHDWCADELFRRYGEYREVFVGNCAERYQAWMQSQAEPPQPAYAPSPQGMTLEERDELVAGALAYCPDFVINGCEESGKWFVAIFESDTDMIELGSLADWARIPQERLRRAAEYGAWYWRQQSLQAAM